MSKFRASDDDIKSFMVAIFPDGAELATAAFDERYVLQEAARLIQALRQDVGTLEHANAQLREELAIFRTARPLSGDPSIRDVQVAMRDSRRPGEHFGE